MVYGQSVEWGLWPLWNWWNWSSNWKLKLKPGPNRRYVLRLGQLKKFHIGAQTLCENSSESSSPPFAEGIWCCLTCYSAWQKLCTATGNNGSFTKRVTVRERGRKGDSMYCTPCSILGKGRELSLQQLQLISFHVSLVCFLSNVLYLIEERCDAATPKVLDFVQINITSSLESSIIRQIIQNVIKHGFVNKLSHIYNS